MLGASPAMAETTKSGIEYKVVKTGKGAVPQIGELVAIKFKGSYKGMVFDDIMEAPEPYYYRVGASNLIKVGTCGKCG